MLIHPLHKHSSIVQMVLQWQDLSISEGPWFFLHPQEFNLIFSPLVKYPLLLKYCQLHVELFSYYQAVFGEL